MFYDINKKECVGLCEFGYYRNTEIYICEKCTTRFNDDCISCSEDKCMAC